MAVSSIRATNGKPNPDAPALRMRAWFASFLTIFKRYGKGSVRRIDQTLRVFQFARTMLALAQLTDGQLAQIGIKRADIPKYAESLNMKEAEARPAQT